MSEPKEYDPTFAQGKAYTIMDVYRDHHARQSKCYCSICWAAKEIIKRNEAESQDTRPA